MTLDPFVYLSEKSSTWPSLSPTFSCFLYSVPQNTTYNEIVWFVAHVGGVMATYTSLTTSQIPPKYKCLIIIIHTAMTHPSPHPESILFRVNRNIQLCEGRELCLPGASCHCLSVDVKLKHYRQMLSIEVI